MMQVSVWMLLYNIKYTLSRNWEQLRNKKLKTNL